MIRVFVVDDHQLFRDGLRLLLESDDEIEVVGEADSGVDILSKIAEAQPTIILMDIQIPDENGIDITRRIKYVYPDMIVLMLTMFEDDQSVFAAMRAGAVGYILKGVKHQEMLQTLRIAAAGGAVFSPRIARHMMQWFDQLHGSKAPPVAPLPELSPREQEVIALLAAGYDNATIAVKLTVTSKTVRNYVSQVLKKLEVTDRAAAAAKARLAGF